ncbi:MAG: hypothetical protein J2P26_12030 [Nocardiopsaceae bacterium]|nr:hypothetical protein [Nocardiopsaceae bacterium]
MRRARSAATISAASTVARSSSPRRPNWAAAVAAAADTPGRMYGRSRVRPSPISMTRRYIRKAGSSRPRVPCSGRPICGNVARIRSHSGPSACSIRRCRQNRQADASPPPSTGSDTPAAPSSTDPLGRATVNTHCGGAASPAHDRAAGNSGGSMCGAVAIAHTAWPASPAAPASAPVWVRRWQAWRNGRCQAARACCQESAMISASAAPRKAT